MTRTFLTAKTSSKSDTELKSSSRRKARKLQEEVSLSVFNDPVKGLQKTKAKKAEHAKYFGPWGIAAPHHIKKGDPLIFEPAFMDLPHLRSRKDVSEAWFSLSKEERLKFENLKCDPRSPSSLHEVRRLERFDANCFSCVGDPIDNIEKEVHRRTSDLNALVRDGVFEVLGTLPHSCSPNANHHWNALRGRMEVFATTDIEKYEPLTIARFSPFMKRSARQFLLKQKGIKCECWSCSMEEDEFDAHGSLWRKMDGKAIRESDGRREELAEYFETMPGETNVEVGIGDCLRALKFWDEESVTGWSGFFFYHLARFYTYSEDFDIALRYMRHARAHYILERGYDSLVVTRILPLSDINAPKWHAVLRKFEELVNKSNPVTEHPSDGSCSD